MNTRRTFLKTAAMAVASGSLMGWRKLANASEAKPLIVRDAKIIRVRERNKGSGVISYLEIASESGIKGYAGPLMAEQVAAFPPNLRELLAGRDAADPEKLNFATLWAACHPGKSLASYADGKDPLTSASVWGITPRIAPVRNRLDHHCPQRNGSGPMGPAREGGGPAGLAAARRKAPARERLRQHSRPFANTHRGKPVCTHHVRPGIPTSEVVFHKRSC